MKCSLLLLSTRHSFSLTTWCQRSLLVIHNVKFSIIKLCIRKVLYLFCLRLLYVTLWKLFSTLQSRFFKKFAFFENRTQTLIFFPFTSENIKKGFFLKERRSLIFLENAFILKRSYINNVPLLVKSHCVFPFRSFCLACSVFHFHAALTHQASFAWNLFPMEKSHKPNVISIFYQMKNFTA